MCLRLLDTDFLKGDKGIQIENTQVILNVEYNCISYFIQEWERDK